MTATDKKNNHEDTKKKIFTAESAGDAEKKKYIYKLCGLSGLCGEKVVKKLSALVP